MGESPGVEVHYSLSKPTDQVDAHIGYINDLLPGLGLDWKNTSAIICASARRIKAVARDLMQLGMKPSDIYTALETNMHCGIGKCDCDRFLEIWNLVFMQFNRKADGSLEGLPAKVIDTGMGFERLVRTLQGKTSNYDTDVFQPILKAIGDMAGKKYGEDEKSDIAMRVIADHIRTIAFSITDGQLPSNAKQVTSSVVSSAVPCATVTRSSDRSRHSCTSSSPYSSRTWAPLIPNWMHRRN